MDNKERMEKILQDLVDRNVQICAFVVAGDDHQKQLISYNDDGLVNFLSEKVEVMLLYKSNKGGGMNSLCSIGEHSKDTSEPESEKEEITLKKNLLDT